MLPLLHRGQIALLIFERREMPVNKLSKFKPSGDLKTTITGKLLFSVLDELANQNEEIIIPQKKISKALRISKSTVSRTLHRLEDIGVIGIIPQYHNDGGRAANKYVLK